MRTFIGFVTVISCVILLSCSGCDTRPTLISQRTPVESSTSDLAVSSPVPESSPTEKQVLTQEIAESETPTAYTQKLEIDTVEMWILSGAEIHWLNMGMEHPCKLKEGNQCNTGIGFK